MQIIALRTLRRFWDLHPEAETPIRNWHARAPKSVWEGPADIKAEFGTAVDFIADNRVIFNLGGNKYRLVVNVAYRYKRVLVKFAGTHADYNRIDPTNVSP